MMGASRVPALFFPPSDRPSFEIQITMPEGTDIEHTRKAVQHLEGFLSEQALVGEGRSEGITNWAAFIGKGAPRYYLSYGPEPPNPAYAIMLLSATSREIMDPLMERIRAYVRDAAPEAKVSWTSVDGTAARSRAATSGRPPWSRSR